MAGSEFSFIVDWGVWLPITIAVFALVLNFYQMRKNSGRNRIIETERSIDRARDTLKECELNLRQCGHEKDELRREKLALLEQVAVLVAKSSSEHN